MGHLRGGRQGEEEGQEGQPEGRDVSAARRLRLRCCCCCCCRRRFDDTAARRLAPSLSPPPAGLGPATLPRAGGGVRGRVGGRGATLFGGRRGGHKRFSAPASLSHCPHAYGSSRTHLACRLLRSCPESWHLSRAVAHRHRTSRPHVNRWVCYSLHSERNISNQALLEKSDKTRALSSRTKGSLAHRAYTDRRHRHSCARVIHGHNQLER